jgi:hypothetical protein
MRHHLVAIALAAVGVACSDGNANGSANATFETAGVWQNELPANVSPPTLGKSVESRGCTYTVGTAVQQPGLPLYLAIVKRSGNVHHCASGYVVLGTSYALPWVDIASGEGALVADFSSKSTPSGEAHTQLRIVQLDPFTGDVLRRATLAAMSPDFQHPQLGNVFTGGLAIGPGGDLTVQGDKNGIIPGEVGSGDHYIAVYERFLRDGDQPVPTSVTSFNAI